ncbi:glycyl-radical enzyme activating protein [Pontiella sulfatireligans]|uniref:Benzylsuccinate synthase activating enzyme n=1 Tax=Pontiella sulfatireligans TaxID=2750658 RepID=A0A6C2UI06_9BACT|nr:glycyl-radical enzyme activating protein [Pontiella sulfatireligans]VGO18964.1 Benzylsuccinate synthase activating enzyme [Pontiella sulfatireligans]
MVRGTIFDIKRFAVHDGPGIRTTVFLKGCPLACHWCHNPEGIEPGIQLWYHESRCIRCGQCVEVCQEKALRADPSGGSFIQINRERCALNSDCVSRCPTHALEWAGREVTVGEVMEEVEKDRLFYEMSGGGVTLSGGEPLQQASFCREILKACKDSGLSTAMETCLFAPRETVDTVIPLVDHFLVDLKLWDGQAHRQCTGEDNTIILENFRYLAERHSHVTVRIPLIKNFTDAPDNIEAIEQFVFSVKSDIPIEKLDYNPLTPSKYRRLGKEFQCS